MKITDLMHGDWFRTKVTIVFEEAIPLDAITYLALTMPSQAVIIITFVFYV